MDAIYNKIEARLKTVPGLKYIDFQMAQLEVDKPPVSFPCALIDLSLPTCNDITDTMQRVKCMVGVMLAFKSDGEQTASIYPPNIKAQSMDYFKTVNAVYKKLQGFGDAEINPLSRKSLYQDLKKGGIKVTMMMFETAFDDMTAEE